MATRRDLFFLTGNARFEDFGLLLLRVATGAFLLYQCHDNVLSSARMAEFEGFMAHFGFWRPELLAPFAIFWQVAAGIGFILGLFVRPLGLITAIQFIVAVWMVHLGDPANIIWSAASLIFIGFYLGLRGSGRYGLDALLEGRPRRR